MSYGRADRKSGGHGVIMAAHLQAARVPMGAKQRKLAEPSGLSMPTIQPVEASEGTVGGNVDSNVRQMDTLSGAGFELVGDSSVNSAGGRGFRLRTADAVHVGLPDPK